MSLETAVGRWVACSCYPHAAWRVMGRRGRAMLVSTYFGAAYLMVLGLLLAAG